MENIFENAYFGKAYRTRDGRKALYIGAKYRPCDDRIYLILEGDKFITEYRPDGEGIYVVCQDIVSEWQEPIDEKKLDELALEYFNKQWCTSYKLLEEITDDLDKQAIDDFKAGYRKAKEL